MRNAATFTNVSYVLPENVENNELFIVEEEAHHLSSVIRKKKGDIVTATDGKGNNYSCIIKSVDRKKVWAGILERFENSGEPKFKLSLGMALIRKERFEFALEKCTELGITKIVPLSTKNTSLPVASFRKVRCQKLLISAVKQCCRSRLPELDDPMSVVGCLGKESGVKLIADERFDSQFSDQIIKEKLIDAGSATVLVGPEGGFSEEEVNEAVENGAVPFGLGTRRLRAETAAIIVVGLILRMSGELG